MSNTIPAAYASHPLVVRFANKPQWINWEPTPSGKKTPKTLWTPECKDDLWCRPHLHQQSIPMTFQRVFTFRDAMMRITKKFTTCGIGFIPVGTDVGCIDCDIKRIVDPDEREAVRTAHWRLCEEFDTFVEQSISGGCHAWIELTNKDVLERYKKIPELHLELFVNYNFVTINPDPKKRNGKPIGNRQALFVEKFPQIVAGYAGNGHVSNRQPALPTGGGAVPAVGENDGVYVI